MNTAQKELNLKLAGYTPEQINAQKANLQQAEANVKSAEATIKSTEANISSIYAQIEKTILKSPINGIITQINYEVGEIVPMNSNVFEIISEKTFQIEADVPEVDIAKIELNDLATITLDAYGSDTEFSAKVLKIDPAETIVEGVPTYKTTFEFVEENDLIKSGMTANIDIITEEKNNVLVLPQRLVFKKNGNKIVQRLNPDNTTEEVIVTTGLRGSDGNIEITSGLNLNDKILTSLPTTN